MAIGRDVDRVYLATARDGAAFRTPEDYLWHAASIATAAEQTVEDGDRFLGKLFQRNSVRTARSPSCHVTLRPQESRTDETRAVESQRSTAPKTLRPDHRRRFAQVMRVFASENLVRRAGATLT
jgi:hypothetical protein